MYVCIKCKIKTFWKRSVLGELHTSFVYKPQPHLLSLALAVCLCTSAFSPSTPSSAFLFCFVTLIFVLPVLVFVLLCVLECACVRTRRAFVWYSLQRVRLLGCRHWRREAWSLWANKQTRSQERGRSCLLRRNNSASIAGIHIVRFTSPAVSNKHVLWYTTLCDWSKPMIFLIRGRNQQYALEEFFFYIDEARTVRAYTFQFNPLTGWVVGGTWGRIKQRFAFSAFCRRPS